MSYMFICNFQLMVLSPASVQLQPLCVFTAVVLGIFKSTIFPHVKQELGPVFIGKKKQQQKHGISEFDI